MVTLRISCSAGFLCYLNNVNFFLYFSYNFNAVYQDNRGPLSRNSSKNEVPVEYLLFVTHNYFSVFEFHCFNIFLELFYFVLSMKLNFAFFKYLYFQASLSLEKRGFAFKIFVAPISQRTVIVIFPHWEYLSMPCYGALLRMLFKTLQNEVVWHTRTHIVSNTELCISDTLLSQGFSPPLQIASSCISDSQRLNLSKTP